VDNFGGMDKGLLKALYGLGTEIAARESITVTLRNAQAGV
jgi:hypothetical protein